MIGGDLVHMTFQMGSDKKEIEMVQFRLVVGHSLPGNKYFEYDNRKVQPVVFNHNANKVYARSTMDDSSRKRHMNLIYTI